MLRAASADTAAMATCPRPMPPHPLGHVRQPEPGVRAAVRISMIARTQSSRPTTRPRPSPRWAHHGVHEVADLEPDLVDLGREGEVDRHAPHRTAGLTRGSKARGGRGGAATKTKAGPRRASARSCSPSSTVPAVKPSSMARPTHCRARSMRPSRLHEHATSKATWALLARGVVVQPLAHVGRRDPVAGVVEVPLEAADGERPGPRPRRRAPARPRRRPRPCWPSRLAGSSPWGLRAGRRRPPRSPTRPRRCRRRGGRRSGPKERVDRRAAAEPWPALGGRWRRRRRARPASHGLDLLEADGPGPRPCRARRRVGHRLQVGAVPLRLARPTWASAASAAAARGDAVPPPP